MKAFEFPATVTEDHQIQLPDNVVKAIPGNTSVRCLVLVDDSAETTFQQENIMWRKLTAEQFLSGYNEADAIYNNA